MEDFALLHILAGFCPGCTAATCSKIRGALSKRWYQSVTCKMQMPFSFAIRYGGCEMSSLLCKNCLKHGDSRPLPVWWLRSYLALLLINNIVFYRNEAKTQRILLMILLNHLCVHGVFAVKDSRLFIGNGTRYFPFCIKVNFDILSRQFQCKTVVSGEKRRHYSARITCNPMISACGHYASNTSL